MRKLLFILALLVPCAAQAQIVLVASCAAVATSCVPSVVGGHSLAAGQFEYTFAYKSSTSAPTKPSSYTQIATASASSSSMRSGCVVLTSSTPDSDAWTSATLVVSLVYSGAAATTTANCVTAGIGFKTTGGTSGTTSTITFTGGSLTHTDNSSWIVAAVGSSAAVCTPATVLASEITTTNGNGLDTNGTVSSYSSKTCTGTTGNWKSDTFELLAAAVANPTFSLAAGTYSTSLPRTSTGSTATTTANLCYNVCTTNGCTPTAPAATTSGTCSTGTQVNTYTNGFVLPNGYENISVLATQAGLANSAVVSSGQYWIVPTLAKWNGATVGATTGNTSKINGATIGTATGNYAAWNGLSSPSTSTNNVSIISANTGGTGGGNVATLVFNFNGNSVTSGNVAFCGVSSFGETLTAGMLTNTAGTSTVGSITLDQSTTNGSAGIYRIPVTGTGTLTLTFNPGGSTFQLMGCAEFSGLNASPLTAVHASSDGTASTSHTTGSVVSTDVGVMIYADYETNSNDFTRTFSDQLIFDVNTASSTYSGIIQYKIINASPNTMTDTTGTDASTVWQVAYALYKSS